MQDNKRKITFKKDIIENEDCESNVSKLIKQIRQADSYDDIGPELYSELCYKKDCPNCPYSEWVATWLLKCIDTTFAKYPYKADIMRASFALLPRYDLTNTTVQERLDRYLHESNYLSKYPSKSKRTLDDIESDPNSQKELDDIKNKLIKMDNNCLQELIKYIEELPNARSHIEDLSDYGTLVSLSDGRKGYKPKLKGLRYPKKKRNHTEKPNDDMKDKIENVPNPWRKKLPIMFCFIAIIVAVIIIAFLICRWHDKRSLETRDTGAETIEEMPKYEPQNRIVNMDELDEYDVEEIYDDLIDYIIRSPLYGDMVAQGLSDLDEIFTNQNPWLTEFIEKTDTAMQLPQTQHPRGMEYWLEYRKGESNNLFTTEEYFRYAAHTYALLDKFTIVGIREWECSAIWEIPMSFTSSSDRAQKHIKKTTQPALIMEFISKKTGKVRFVIGFSLLGGHMMIYDPEIVQ